jgi:YD repeat-containing protein
MANKYRIAKVLLMTLVAVGNTGISLADVLYTYDRLGRVTTARYDNDVCILYTYDANGNRISQLNVVDGTPISPIWGTGSWGCLDWQPDQARVSDAGGG